MSSEGQPRTQREFLPPHPAFAFAGAGVAFLALALVWDGFSILSVPTESAAYEVGAKGLSIQQRTERWAALPLLFTLDVGQDDAVKQFVEEKERLKADLSALATGALGIPSAADAVGLLPPVERSQLALMGATFDEQARRAAAREYVTDVDKFREAVAVVVADTRKAQAASQNAGIAVHGQASRELGAGIALFMVVLGAGAGVIRRWLSRWFSAAAAIAAEKGAIDAPPPGQAVASRAAMRAILALGESLQDQRHTTALQVHSQDMLREFTEALETVDDEEEIVLLFLRCLSIRHARLRPQLLLADQSEEELRPTVPEGPGGCVCSPMKPGRCKALRLGRVLRVDAPGSIAACPRMEQDSPAPYGCVPLSIAGRSAGVLRLASDGDPVTLAEILDCAAVAQRFAVRVGVQRLLNTTTRQARTDPLTGLPNRRVGIDQLDRMIKQQRDGGSRFVAVFGLDLDHFKRLNDTFGHAAGDTAIRASVAAARQALPAGAILARIGGEEFMVCVPVQTRAEGMRMADGICAAVRALTKVGGPPATTVSIGVSFAPEDGQDHETVMRACDDRLYLAKNNGRDRAVGPDEVHTLPKGDGTAEVERAALSVVGGH